MDYGNEENDDDTIKDNSNMNDDLTIEDKEAPPASWEEMWKEGILFGVPKQKVSVRRRRIRHTAQACKLRKSFKVCPTCNNKILRHHLCPHCTDFNGYIRSKETIFKKNVVFAPQEEKVN